MTRWQRWLLDLLYVGVESVPWFMAIAVMATAAERTYLRDVAGALQVQIALGEIENPVRGTALVAELLRDSTDALAGPGFLIVLLTGLGGFGLMRAVQTAKLNGALGAVVVLVASVLGLNVMLHLGLAGNLLIWDNGGLAEFLDNPTAFTAEGADLQRLVDRGGVVLGSGTAVALTFAAMIAVWVRFMAAARGVVGFERVLRSFGFGFVAVLVLLVFARVSEIGQLAPYAVPYFVFGLLALAVANSERAALRAEGRERVAPWSVSVLATIGLLLAVAAVFGLLAALDFASFAAWVGGGIGWAIERLLVIILTPIFWVLVPLLDWLIPDGVADRLREMQLPQTLLETANEVAEDGEESTFPAWPLQAAKLLVFVGLVWVAYRVSRALLGRKEERSLELYDELRSASGSGGSGLGGLLRGLLRRGGGATGQGWFGLQPIYAVYGRSVLESEDRGFERRLSETPLEYAAASARELEAPLFQEIADAFDAARYGRHYPSEAQVEQWRQALRAWESAHPKSPELQHHLEVLRPPRHPAPVDPADEFADRVKKGREAFQQMRSGPGVGPTGR
ncbi:MAG: DUF4129 domain-containing protein [Dehalococcoidia bacterium]|jgi:hypothetical protein|nr:DUF4129 domain-containing protein [Dehalococcoidia bacterium]